MGPAVSVWGLMIVRNLTQAFFLFVTYRLSVGVYYFVYIYYLSAPGAVRGGEYQAVQTLLVVIVMDCHSGGPTLALLIVERINRWYWPQLQKLAGDSACRIIY